MAALDEPIYFADHNPRWFEYYAIEADRISSGLPAGDIGVEHIGSTAVPGLLAKPIIDVMVGTKRSNNLPAVRAALVTIGYEDLGEAGVPGRIYFRKREGQAFNVALVEYDGSHWKSNLAIRDFLKVNPGAAQEYAEIKATAFQQGLRSLLAYSDFKAAFIAKLLREALASKPH
jgi:GrpB-like predicted nucleotidyltransferase (UPF0157 family)